MVILVLINYKGTIFVKKLIWIYNLNFNSSDNDGLWTSIYLVS